MDVIDGADVFVGVSGPDVLPAEAVALMAPNPVIFACSNPDPEIKPALARRCARDDLIMATGRSDYPEPGQQRALASRSSSAVRSTCARGHQRCHEDRGGTWPCGSWPSAGGDGCL
jgi:hypothetical protein